MPHSKYQFEKHFTPAEASRTLPLVKRIVKDILDTAHQIHSLQQMTGDPGAHPQVQALEDQLRGFFEELESLGCFYKDWNYNIGLVDFPAIINDREVFLCWRSDEPELRFYHRIEDGYRGRQPIPKALFEQQRKEME